MISEWYAKAFCCEDISRIENYEKAIADKKCKWNVHHRLECVNGVFTSRKELIAKGLYYNRPANELIFLTPSDHQSLHIKNPNTLMKISKSLNKPEVKKKKSTRMKRVWQDPEYQQRHSASVKRVLNDPVIKQKMIDAHKRACQNPEYKQKMHDIHKRMWKDPAYIEKMRNAKLGKHWYTDGINNKFVFECPGEGWRLGKTHHKKRS